MMQQPQQEGKSATVVFTGGQYAGQPSITSSETTNVMKTSPNYKGKQSKVIGTVLIIGGLISIVFNSIELGVGLGRYYTYNFVFGEIGHGYWVGIPCLITGVLAVRAASSQTKRQIHVLNVLCLATAVLAAAQFIIGMVAVTETKDYYCCDSCYEGHECVLVRGFVMGMEAALLSVGFFEMIAAIWGTVICCKACGFTLSPRRVVHWLKQQTCCQNQYSGMPMMVVIVNENPSATKSAALSLGQSQLQQPKQVIINQSIMGAYLNGGYTSNDQVTSHPAATESQMLRVEDQPSDDVRADVL